MQIHRNIHLPVLHISRVFSARADSLNVTYIRSLQSLHKQQILYYIQHSSLIPYTHVKRAIFTAVTTLMAISRKQFNSAMLFSTFVNNLMFRENLKCDVAQKTSSMLVAKLKRNVHIVLCEA